MMIIIKNGTIVDPVRKECYQGDIQIEGNQLTRLARETEGGLAIPEGARVIKAQGLMVAPGLADTHVHFRDPGFTYKEDIQTGGAAAAKGGFTEIVLMANTRPCVDNKETLAYVLAKGKNTGIHIQSCANVTKGMGGKELVDMEELSLSGAAGFTDDGIPLVDEKLVREAMERAAALRKPISFHEEDPALITNNGINSGRAAAHFGIKGSPREAEINLARRDIALARLTGAEVVIQHISAKETVALLRQAKAEGICVHGEATPHHFTLTQEAVIEKGTLAKMNPPLREEEDRLAIIRGIQDGTIDLIATDHAPHSREEKEKPVTEAPSGIIGLETALALGITKLVQEGCLTMRRLLELMSTNPAKLYHLDAGYLDIHGPGDLILVDTSAEVIPGNYVSRASNTPFTGWKLKGKVVTTICDGKVVYTE